MMLRGLVILVAMVSFAGALAATAVDWTNWPMLMVAVILCSGIVFEHVRYKGSQCRPTGPGWRETSERFIDEASGRPVIVWFNAATGERRYVDDPSVIANESRSQ